MGVLLYRCEEDLDLVLRGPAGTHICGNVLLLFRAGSGFSMEVL